MKDVREVIVELSPGRVALSVVGGQRVLSTASARVAARGGEAFIASLGAFAEPLGALVRAAGALGADAMVLYSGSDAAVGVFSCVQKAGERQATRAASLALGDAASLDLAQNPHGLHPVMTDATGAGAPPQVHTLGVAASDAEVRAIAELVEAAGLRFAGAIPDAAVGTLEAVELARSAAPAQGESHAAIVLHLSEHHATIVGVSAGRLRFVRQASIGLESLADPISREHLPDATGAAHPVTRDEAREFLLQRGIPAPGEVVEVRPGVRTSVVRSMLQSTLQRLVVELKQSTRFGLSEAERGAARLQVAGLGARVPGLDAVMAEMAGLAMQPVAEGAERVRALRRTADSAAVGIPDSLCLMSQGAMQARTVGVVRRGVLIGSAAVLLVMGISYTKMSIDLGSMNAEIRRLETPHAEGTEAAALVEQVRAYDRVLTTSREALQKARPTRVRVEAMLLALAEAARPEVRLTAIDLDANDDAVARLSGKVRLTPGQDATDVLGDFLDAVTASPAVDACKLASTRRGGGEDEGTLLFEMTVDLTSLPGSSLAFYTITQAPSKDAQEDQR